MPALHASPAVAGSPSSHAVPSGADGFEQAPVDGSHAPAVWHWSDAAQTTGSRPMHEPASHASLRVQVLPSLHALPSAFAGFEHAPVVGSHVPASWHWSDAV